LGRALTKSDTKMSRRFPVAQKRNLESHAVRSKNRQ
jgi:hypothetical protein